MPVPPRRRDHIEPAAVSCEVLLNVGPGALMSFRPGVDKLARASFGGLGQISVPEGDMNEVLDYVWRVCNLDRDDLDDQRQELLARRYRRSKNRSLSMGDVVLVHDGEGEPRIFTAVTVGYEEISLEDFAGTEVLESHWSEHFGLEAPDLTRLR